MLEQAQAVAVGQVPPGPPAEHRRAVQQQDPLDGWVGAGLQEPPHSGVQRGHRVDGAVGLGAGGDLVGDVGLDGLGHGGEQGGLVAELMVQRAAGHPGRLDDLLGADTGVAALREQDSGGGDQPPAGRLRAQVLLGLLGSGHIHTCPSYCLYVNTYMLSVS